MLFINNRISTDPAFNLALEEYCFETLGSRDDCFMLWQNANAIIIGRHQNTVEEINDQAVQEEGIQVVRRMTGGGAVYHDLGNLNFTYILNQQPAQDFDFGFFIHPVINALKQMGVEAVFNSRNDIEIDGKKFSGNAQYSRHGRVLHHGTLLYNSRLDKVARALRVKPQKIASKGVKSVQSRITNIAEYLPEPYPIDTFREKLTACLFEDGALTPYALTAADLQAVRKLRDEKYATWKWNYGQSPAYDRRIECKYPFGLVTALMTIKKGCIDALHFYGDFFSSRDITELAGRFTGIRLEKTALADILETVTVSDYINGMCNEDFLDFMLSQ